MSDDGEDMEQINVKVPARTKELAKQRLEHGGITRVVRESLTRVAHGEEASEKERVKDHLEELRDERRELKNERNQIDDKLDELDVKIERAEDRLDELRDKEGEYEGALQMIESAIRGEDRERPMNVFVGHGQVEHAAELANCSQEDVIEDLKERNPNLPDSRFTKGSGGIV